MISLHSERSVRHVGSMSSRQKPPVHPRIPGDKLEPLSSMRVQRLVGRIIMKWAHLEAGIEQLIWSLLNVDVAKGRLITTGMDANRKITLLVGLMNLDQKEEWNAGFAVVIDKIRICQEDRNMVAHSTWARSGRDRIPFALSLKPKTSPHEIVAEAFPIERMRAIAIDIDFCWGMVLDLAHRLDPANIQDVAQ